MLLAVLPAEWVARRCSPKLSANYYINKINNLEEIALLAKLACSLRGRRRIKSMA
jgi:hypothetical protein